MEGFPRGCGLASVHSIPQVQMAVEAKFVQDTLKGDGVTEIRMRFIRRIEDNLPAGEE